MSRTYSLYPDDYYEEVHRQHAEMEERALRAEAAERDLRETVGELLELIDAHPGRYATYIVEVMRSEYDRGWQHAMAQENPPEVPR
jgi:hypothetical protein